MIERLPPERRIVITGLGAVTPNGRDMPTTWREIREGRSRIDRITLFDASEFAVKIAGEVRGFDPRSFLSEKDARRADRNVQFALVAADEAVRHAGLNIARDNADDIGVLIGSGAGGIWTYVRQQKALDARGPKGLSPMLIPMIVSDSASVQVGIRLKARGPNVGVASACSTSLDAIGLALETIRRGDAKAMIAGGTEAAVNELGIGGFDRLKALSRRNDDPKAASRPFDSARDGFVLSEGSVVLVIESLAHARGRGAEPLAELLSYAATSDGLHFTKPDQTGASAALCVKRALAKAGLGAEEIDYINAHATGTPVGDRIEVAAIKKALGGRATVVPVSSTKSTTGHLLGAAGALAIALTVMALREGCLPPTINLTDPDPDCDLNHVVDVARPSDARTALALCSGFGGHNSCLLVRKWVE